MHLSKKSPRLLCAVVILFVVTASVKYSLLAKLAYFSIQFYAFSETSLTEMQIDAALGLLDINIRLNKNDTSPDMWNTKNFILVVTSWRSGSTFFGEVIANHPSVFLHYEPLWHFGVRQIRSGDEVTEALDHLKSFLQCRFDNDQYNQAIDKYGEGLLGSNIHTWGACIKVPDRKVCSTPSYLQRACHKFPTMVAKIVRMRLNLTKPLLEDPDLHPLKVIYLVRDPRPTWLSRKVLGWCNSSRDCIDPKRICDDIDSDLHAMQELSKTYPDRLMLVRYETLTADPLKTFESVFRFTGLSFLPSINKTIRSRPSQKSADHWRSKLNQSEIDYIERDCMNVIDRLNHL